MTLLRTTDTPVTDVCMQVGFSSLGTFSRTFAEVVGLTPSEYPGGTGPGRGVRADRLPDAVNAARRVQPRPRADSTRLIGFVTP